MKNVEPICKTYLELRYQLLPYNYTITREAVDTGMPLMRALLLAYPDDPTAVSLGDEYLWGPNMLVAPVVEKGATWRKVYLPKLAQGNWYDFWTGTPIDPNTYYGPTKTDGQIPLDQTVKTIGRWISRNVDLATMPIYVKAGAILPMDPIRQYTAEKATGPTTLHIYPGADGTFTLYDDDGHTEGYLAGTDPQTQWIKFTYTDATRTLAIDPDARMKQLPGGTRTFKVQVVGSNAAPAEIVFTGKHAELKVQ
jgi:alpha-glucosidase/alpha-D-xyloside xylohydrolase